MMICIAIVIVGAFIATAIVVAFRWQIVASGGDVYRLDRWTGRIVECNTDGSFTPGAEFVCDQR
jgi:hypothetical protein